MGGSTVVSSLIEAGLVDELRLIVYPLIAGEGRGPFAAAVQRRDLRLTKADWMPDGRLSVIYKAA